MTDWVYDIETFKTVFTYCAVTADKKKGVVCEISERKNELMKLIKHLRSLKNANARMVGFNNLSFDYPVVHWIIDNYKPWDAEGYSGKLISSLIYDKAQKTIEASNVNKFATRVRHKDVLIPQVDLYLIHHFDNKARATSLKAIQFNMNCNTIEDLPYHHDDTLTDEQIDKLISYNKHDVMRTLDFYNASEKKITLRKNLTEKYGFDCTNYNDTKIGKQLFINRLEEANPGCCYTVDERGKRHLNQTIRPIIHLSEVMLPYLKYTRPEFQAVANWFKDQSITETKGVFTGIKEYKLGDVAKYAELTKKKVKLKGGKPSDEQREALLSSIPMSWIEEVQLKAKIPKKHGGGFKMSYYHCWNEVSCLNVVVDGLRWDFGTGGLHAARPNCIIEATEDTLIESVDVSSFYPNLSIKNKLYPAHVGELFCTVYEELYEERKTFDKKTSENLALKLALNGTYGASNDEYSPLYDPQFTMAITIGGQTSLMMLGDMLMQIPSVRVVMVNTDGLEYTVDKEYLEQSRDVCKQWEAITKLELEGVSYSKMFILNVNNYYAIYTNGKVKRKGCFEYEDLDWNKNFSSLVVQKAVEHEILGRGSVEEFINSHDVISDFMLRVKVPRNSRLVTVEADVDKVQQNIARYYPSVNGGKLVKIMPPLEEGGEERRLSIEADWNVKVCNDMREFDGDINRLYYINEARKLLSFDNKFIQEDEEAA